MNMYKVIISLALVVAFLSCKNNESKKANITPTNESLVDSTKSTSKCDALCATERGLYPNATNVGLEEGDKYVTPIPGYVLQPYRNINNADSLMVADTNHNPGVKRVDRMKLCFTTTPCGCNIVQTNRKKAYECLVGYDKNGNPLLGSSNIVARPCPPNCYGGDL